MVFFLFTAYGSYRAFEWTESVEFCGKTCHEVMEPEFTAYQNSPHARVACVNCHVGPGAGWYVQSKLSGAYQVYSVLANAYSQPIATPIHNLRPAQETCEQCHWPSHFSGRRSSSTRTSSRIAPTPPGPSALLMKIGGGDPSRGPAEGIHWHMNIANEILFVASDSLSQVIPWTMLRNKETGKMTEYLSTDAPIPRAHTGSVPRGAWIASIATIGRRTSTTLRCASWIEASPWGGSAGNSRL